MESNENEAYQTKKHVLIIRKVLIWSLDIRIRIVSLFSDSNTVLFFARHNLFGNLLLEHTKQIERFSKNLISRIYYFTVIYST